MKDQFNEYLLSLDAPKPIFEIVRHTIRIAEELCGEEVIDIHISDSLKGDNLPEFDELEMFTKHFILSRRLLDKDTNIQLGTISGNVKAFQIVSSNFDFNDIEKNSTMRIGIKFDYSDSLYTLYSTGQNCDHLKEMIKRYIKPNLAN
ncbi:MAG: hypothetical protein HQ568_10610 [Calditrichaeota bacterium]|nr:hypothetical protein [Calditrichota bacterium]